MSQSRIENVCPTAHLRVVLSSAVETLPPTYIDINNMDIPPPQPDFSAPPPYDVAANSKLPTYEEVQREKQLEGEVPQLAPPVHPGLAAFVTVEPRDGSAEQLDPENNLLGTDVMFLTSFFGILICVRAVIQYLNIKRGWRLLSGTAQERLLFFY
ncbi:unnamed protein product [Leptidea sinapis]|uniref:Uncharacterized protein n=1 Tax=Leptidea sinapis TaxID=189913 RepID=A0A5E4PNB3_9NEOP|nr:unnamed protein product [Leptidea sinapis]